MATPFSKIYDRAVFRFSDYDFLKFTEEDYESILEKYLKMAESDFVNTCLFDLKNKDEENKEYIEDLDDESIEILALGIAYYWLSRKVINSDLLKNNMSTKDYTFFSPANLLREMTVLRDDVKKEFKQKIIDYSYTHGNISDLKV